MIELVQLIDKYGWMVVGGTVGAIIDRLRKSMSLKRFVANIFISAFVGLCTGIVIGNYTSFSQEVQFVCVSISGYFSQYLLDETQEMIEVATSVIKQGIKSYRLKKK